MTLFIDNKYKRIYYEIIENATNRTIISGTYTEKHHIIPKSLGGSNSSTNLIMLTAREHYICHRLLVKMTSGIAKQKMSYALHRMTNKSVTFNIPSRVYEYIRKNHSAMLSEKYTGMSIQERFGKPYPHNISDYQKMRIKESNSSREWSDISRKKLSDTQKQRYKDNPKLFEKTAMSNETKEKISISRKNRAIKYTFVHEEFGEFIGSTGDMSRRYNIIQSEVWKLAVGRYKSYKGWKIQHFF